MDKAENIKDKKKVPIFGPGVYVGVLDENGEWGGKISKEEKE